MIEPFAVYNESSGEILATGHCPKDLVELQGWEPEHRVYVGEADPASHYIDVDTGTLCDKQQAIYSLSSPTLIADGIASVQIHGLDKTSTVTWPDGLRTPITDGFIEFSVDLPGTYKIVIEAVPYLTQEITIEAISPTES